MDEVEIREIAADIAQFVIDQGRVEGDDREDWIASLVIEVMMEADERGYANASEIGAEAERQYRNENKKR
jgi:hypothetical protein